MGLLRFDGNDGLDWQSISTSLQNTPTGAWTFLTGVRHASIAGYQGYTYVKTTGNAVRAGFSKHTGADLFHDVGGSAAYSNLEASAINTDYLFVASKGAGNVAPNGSRKIGSGGAWLHQIGSAFMANESAGQRLEIGTWQGGDFLNAWLSVVAIWNVELSQAQREACGTNWRTSDIYNAHPTPPLVLIQFNAATGSLVNLGTASIASPAHVGSPTLDNAQTFSGWNFNGLGESSSEDSRDARLQGKAVLETVRDIRIRGEAVSDSSRDVRASGSADSNDSRDVRATGGVGSYTFDGTNDRLTYAANLTQLDLNEYLILSWVRRTGGHNNGRIFGRASGTIAGHMQLMMGSAQSGAYDRNFSLRQRTSGTVPVDVAPINTLPATAEWVCIGGRYRASQVGTTDAINLYYNGSFLAAGSQTNGSGTTDFATTEAIVVGSNNGADRPFGGQVAYVGVWNVATLTDVEVATLVSNFYGGGTGQITVPHQDLLVDFVRLDAQGAVNGDKGVLTSPTITETTFTAANQPPVSYNSFGTNTLDTRDARATGTILSSDTRDVRLGTNPTSSDTRDVRLTGQSGNVGVASLPLLLHREFTDPAIATDVRLAGESAVAVSDSRDVRLSGQAGSTQERDARLRGQADISETRDVRLRGQLDSTDARDVRIRGQADLAATQDARVTGQAASDSAYNIRARGEDAASDTRDVRLEGIVGGTTEARFSWTEIETPAAAQNLATATRDVRLRGQADTSSAYDARLRGTATLEAVRDIRLRGAADSFVVFDTRLTGQVTNEASFDVRLRGQFDSTYAQDVRATGAIVAVDTRDVRLRAQAVSEAVRDARVTGQASATDSRDVRLTGQTDASQSYDVRVRGQADTARSQDVRLTGADTASLAVDVRTVGEEGYIEASWGVRLKGGKIPKWVRYGPGEAAIKGGHRSGLDNQPNVGGVVLPGGRSGLDTNLTEGGLIHHPRRSDAL